MLKKLSTLYMSQLLKAILPLIFVPMTISILGVEEYGLVSFMTMLIGVLGVFDMGISGTFIKTVSVGKDNAVTYDKVISFFLKAICFFFLISLILSLVFFVFADNIYTSWLKTNVSYAEALVSIKLIGFILACTYFKSYISSFLQGMEKQVHLSLWGAVYSILFYAGAYYSIKYVESSLSFFFFILSLVVLVDIIVLSSILILIIHNHKKSISTVESMSVSSEDEMDLSVSGIIKLSLHLSGLSIIWVISNQVDKIALSTYSNLEVYVHYQIAAQLAATVTMLTMPISQYLMPRLSSLYKRGHKKDFVRELAISIFGFIMLFAPIAPYFFFFGDDLISTWMMKEHLGGEINKYACWLVSAAVVSSIMNFLFLTLYAMSRLKLHLYIYAIYSCVTIPISVFVAKYYGTEGSAKFLFLHSFVFMLIWGSIGFNNVVKGILMPLFLSLLYALFISSLVFKLLADFGVGVYGWLGIFIPPVINIVVLALPIIAMKKMIFNHMSEITLRKNI